MRYLRGPVDPTTTKMKKNNVEKVDPQKVRKKTMSMKSVPRPPAGPPARPRERGVWGRQPLGKRKKSVYILIYISIYMYTSMSSTNILYDILSYDIV